MVSFSGRKAVVTGGGSGMGRELTVLLASEGCSVATCDVDASSVAETGRRAEKAATGGAKVTTHVCDVSNEAEVMAFHDEVVRAHGSPLHLLFNNAGVGGGASFLTDPREEWERTFAVDWGGVYLCTRAFIGDLLAADEAVLVNTSSVNGFWASLGPGIPNTAYSTAKFAVKGFSEALIEDFRAHAPHVKVAVVMPGHIGTDIVANSRRFFGGPEPDEMGPEDLERVRALLRRRGLESERMSDDEVRGVVQAIERGFRERAPLDAASAARIILEGVRAGRWRILVGADAERLDERVRADPEGAYDHRGGGIGLL